MSPRLALAPDSAPICAPSRPPVLPLRARVVAEAELPRLLPAWRELAAAASVPNVFYESFMLLPALAELRGAVAVDVVVVEDKAGALMLLAPFERRSSWRGLPVPARALWMFRHCYLNTPLVRAGAERPALAALLDWAAGAAPLLELRGQAVDTEVHRALLDLVNERGLEASAAGRHTRALLLPAADAETYLSSAVSGGKRKELRRQERRLGELGSISYTASPDLERNLAELLALELTGWKGRDGGAMALDPADRRWFETICRAAHADGRLIFSTLRVGDRPVASKCSFLAGQGAFAFKIAYDESMARFSPGVLLELDNVRRIHARPEVQWMDSCAAWDHPMINGLWKDRLAIETLLVAPRGRAAAALVAAAPLMRHAARGLKQLFRRHP